MPLPDVVSGLLLSGRPPVRVWSGVPCRTPPAALSAGGVLLCTFPAAAGRQRAAFALHHAFAVSSPEQVLIIRVAKGGEMLGAACVQVAFNLGNAIGAYVGGLAISGGYRYPALAGVPFAMVGFILFLTFYKKYQAKY